MRLFSPKAKVVTDYEWLEEHLGNLIPMEVVLNVDPLTSRLSFLERMELVQRVQKEVETIPEVGKSLSAATFSANLGQAEQPDAPKPKKTRRGIAGLARSLAGVKDEEKLTREVRNKKLEEHRDEYLNSDYLREKDGREMWRISARVSAAQERRLCEVRQGYSREGRAGAWTTCGPSWVTRKQTNCKPRIRGWCRWCTRCRTRCSMAWSPASSRI